MAVISIGVTLIFVAIAITSLYISYLCRAAHARLGKKAVDLTESIKQRTDSGKHAGYTVSQAWFMKQVMSESETGVSNRLRDFSSTGSGRFIVLAAVLASAGLGIVIGLGLSLYNQDTAIQIGIFPLIVIITYVFLVLLSEVIATIKFSSHMSKIDCNALGKKDLKVFLRALHILDTRKKQFVTVAGLLVLYGIFSEIIGLIIVGIFAVIEIFFIEVLGNAIFEDFIVIVVLVGALLAVFVSIVISRIYIAFLKFLMRIDFSEIQQDEVKAE